MFSFFVAIYLFLCFCAKFGVMSSPTKFPTTTIANVTVVDTPLVRDAIAYARKNNDDMTYNHVMRSWLFGVTLYQKLHAVGAMPEVDLEAHAIAVILHDLGWSDNKDLISNDKCFEVDGAIAARNWLEQQSDKAWDVHRLQLVWDSIALHTYPRVGTYKEPVVQLCGLGIICDFQGPNSDPTKLLTWDDFDAVKNEFPRLDLAVGIREKITHFCKTKPETTYDSWQMAYGKKYVEGYAEKAEQNLIINVIDNSI